MKYLIASDIHGSAYWTERLCAAIESEQPDRIVLLGDLLYHGPRNDLPRDYAPKRVIPLLNALADRDEHSARLADQAVVLVSQADREEADASSIARGYDALARAVVTVPYDPAMRQQWLRVDNLAAPTQRAYLRAAAAVAAGL